MTEEDRRPEEIDGVLGGIPFKGTLSQGGDLEIDPDVFVQAIERQLFFHRLTSRICGLGFMSEAGKKKRKQTRPRKRKQRKPTRKKSTRRKRTKRKLTRRKPTPTPALHRSSILTRG